MSGPVLLILRILLAASLYAFLGLAFYLLWRDLKAQAGLAASRQPPILGIICQVAEETTSRRFNLPEIILGRDPTCDWILEDSTVSAQHTRLSFRQGQWWVEDLRSTNGTFLNQAPVATPMVITSGDRLRCGQAVLTITVGESE